MEEPQGKETFKLTPSSSCAIIKTNGLFGCKPLKRFPQTNLIHKKKTRKMYSCPSIKAKKPNDVVFSINLLVNVKVTQELKNILGKILARSPRCKIFRDLYSETETLDAERVFTSVFSLDSEHPFEETAKIKKIYELVIISTKTLLVYDAKCTCIDNDNLVIYHCDNCPRLVERIKEKVFKSYEYNFIELPGISNDVKTVKPPRFLTVLSPKRKIPITR